LLYIFFIIVLFFLFIIKKGLLNESKRHKEIGNQYFNEKEYNKALEEYKQAADICPHTKKEDLAIYYNNMAACYVYIVRVFIIYIIYTIYIIYSLIN